VSPSPLLRDVGSKNNASAPSEARTPLQPPLPFPKGCGPAQAEGKRQRGNHAKEEGEEEAR